MPEQPLIRQYIAPGGLGWVIAIIVLFLCILFYFVPQGIAPVALLLIALLAVSRLT